MSSFENDLYQQMILDHNRSPQNFRELQEADIKAEGFNPLCGDHLWVYIKYGEGKKIADISFQGSGCAISKASASMMTSAMKGKVLEDAESVFLEFRKLITGELSPKDAKHLGKLKVFAGICRYPSRVKCAGLAWHTLHDAIHGQNQVSSTE